MGVLGFVWLKPDQTTRGRTLSRPRKKRPRRTPGVPTAPLRCASGTPGVRQSGRTTFTDRLLHYRLSASGRYDDAKETLDSVLEKDPYNEVAWRKIENINKAKRRVADIAREANAPLRPDYNAVKPNDWLPWGLLGALVLTSVTLVLRAVFGSNVAQNGKAGASALLPLGWYVLAVSVLTFAAMAIRYQIVFTPNENDPNVLKLDRWTGSVEWLGD